MLHAVHCKSACNESLLLHTPVCHLAAASAVVLVVISCLGAWFSVIMVPNLACGT